MAIDVRIKRAYADAGPDDGFRVLIDRMWPRGVSRDRAHVDDWAKDLAPSDRLRRWFGHDPERFDEFRARYREELRAQEDRVAGLAARAAREPVTLVYGARDERHNNAVVLAELLRERSG